MFNRYIKVKDSNCLVRDRESGAIINLDRTTKERFLKKRENQQLLEKRVDSLEQSIHALDNKLNAILNILTNSNQDCIK